MPFTFLHMSSISIPELTAINRSIREHYLIESIRDSSPDSTFKKASKSNAASGFVNATCLATFPSSFYYIIPAISLHRFTLSISGYVSNNLDSNILLNALNARYQIIIRHQRHVPELFCLLHTALGEASSGEEEEVLVLIREQLAAGDERLQDGKIDLLRCPFALGEEGGVLVLLAHDVDFGLALMNRIVAPPAAQGSELHRGFAAEQQLPEVLLADLLEHFAHILAQVRLDALVDQVRRAARDHGGVLRHEAIPEAEHIVIDGIDRLLGRLLAIGRLFLHDAQRDEVLEIGGADVRVLSHFGGDLRHAGSTGGDGGDDRRVDRRFPDLLLQKIRRLLVEGGGGVQIGVLDVLFDAEAVVHLQKVLRRPTHDPVGKSLLLGGEVAKIAAGLLKVEGLQLDLRRAPAVQRRLVG